MAINPTDNNAQIEVGPAINVADTANELLLRTRLVGDVNDRLQITCGGAILTGDGSGAPAAVTPVADALLVHKAGAETITGDKTFGKVGFNSAAPVAKASAYTQTYSTAARTVATATVAAVATDAAGLTAYGYTQAQADSIPVAINALTADVLALRKLVNALIDDLQAIGISG